MEKLVIFISGLLIGSSGIMFLVVLLSEKGDIVVPVAFLTGGVFLAIVGFSSK